MTGALMEAEAFTLESDGAIEGLIKNRVVSTSDFCSYGISITRTLKRR
jgi:hypothetical protein